MKRELEADVLLPGRLCLLIRKNHVYHLVNHYWATHTHTEYIFFRDQVHASCVVMIFYLRNCHSTNLADVMQKSGSAVS